MSSKGLPSHYYKDYGRSQLSECVADLEYDEENQILTVVFNKRGTYRYFDFSLDEYLLFSGASSRGTYFNLYVRDRYAYERIA